MVVFADVVGVSSKKLKKFFSRTLLFLLLLLLREGSVFFKAPLWCSRDTQTATKTVNAMPVFDDDIYHHR